MVFFISPRAPWSLQLLTFSFCVAARLPAAQIAALTKSPAQLRAFVRGEQNSRAVRLRTHRCQQVLDFRYRGGNIQCLVSWQSPKGGQVSSVWENYSEARANESFSRCLRLRHDEEQHLCELSTEDDKDDDGEKNKTKNPNEEVASPEEAQELIQRVLPHFDDLEFHCYCVLYARAMATGFVGPNFLADFTERRRIQRFLRRRKQQLLDLQELSEKWTELAGVSVSVENRVDFATPAEFTYVSECFSKDVTIPDDPIIGCECRSCNVHRECCPNLSGSTSFAYNRDGTLKLGRGKAIYECNRRCKCDSRCMNRVVQHGPRVPFVVFKTTDRGWALRTAVAMKAGQFVCEYTGEVVDCATAETRGKEYDSIGLTYLFDLDYNNQERPYTIDAYAYGNMSRFMNHSCDPNCAIWAAYVDCLDPNLPRLAIFTRRRLEAGEELTFDYNMGSGSAVGEEEQISTSPKKVKQIGQCFCKAKKCRNYLFDAIC